MIKRLLIDNFKSYVDVNIPLGSLNVFVGPNASGKSNLVDALRFIGDAIKYTLDIAIAGRSGWGGVRSGKTNRGRVRFKLDVAPREPYDIVVETPDKVQFTMKSFEYTFAFLKERGRYIVDSERLSLQTARLKKGLRAPVAGFKRSRSTVVIRDPLAKRESLQVTEHTFNRLFMSVPFSASGTLAGDFIDRWCFFDIDVRRARDPQYEGPVEHLSESGDNLGLLLYRMERDTSKKGRRLRESIVRFIQGIVPGFENVYSEEQYDGKIAFRIKERNLRPRLPASVVSDGTIKLLALTLALRYHRRPPTLICIEEPEKNLHPTLLEVLVDVMRELSKDTQIIVTTHSPEFVRCLRPHEVYLVDKKEGKSRITRVQSVEAIDVFLKEFSLDELWKQGYLEGGIPL